MDFISKKKGLIIARLNPEEYFGKKFDNPENYHYHLGLMHGQLLKEEIQEMADYLPKFLIETRGKIMGKMAYKVLVNRARVIKKYIQPECLIEMEGVAKGAKVDPDFILLINVFDELKNCQSKWWIVPTLLDLGGCSALATEENKSLLYGVNTDYTVFGDKLGPNNTVFVYQKKNGPNFTAIGWPGYVGLIRGMNDQGTVLISLSSYSTDQTIKGIPTSFLYRKMIEFNEPSLIATASRTIGNNILIGDKNEAAVIEVSAKDWRARKSLGFENKKFITATNHYQTGLKETQRDPVLPPGSTIPKNEEERWFWNFFGLNGSIERNNTLKTEMQKSKKFTPETIKEILHEVHNPHCTLACTIFDPANLTLYMADNEGKMPATKGKLVKINLGNLWKL